MNIDKTLLFHITNQGQSLAERIAEVYPSAEIRKYSGEAMAEFWAAGNVLVFIMAAGIAVRAIAPHVRDKATDPAVLVVDEKGRHVVSLLSGHMGGANHWAAEVARVLGAEPVITTASDVSGLPALDLWAEERNLAVENRKLLPKIGTKFLNTNVIKVWCEKPCELPPAFTATPDRDTADVLVGSGGKTEAELAEKLCLAPRALAVGIGCNSGTGAEEIEAAVRAVISGLGLSFHAIAELATIELKSREPGLLNFAQKHGFCLTAYSNVELNAVSGIVPSEAVYKVTGAKAVAEPAAILLSRGGRLVQAKVKSGNVTVAVAEMAAMARIGRIEVIGTGPGGLEHITPRARRALREADVVVGYGTYIDLIRAVVADKEVVSTGMTQEIDRARRAIELAREGRSVAVVSGGDPGIYAMAGLVLELAGGPGAEIPITVIPGISALNAGAARLGAPLMHDFAVVSLSDRLTPWETIEKRLDAAAAADFVMAIYNPKSRGRAGHIEKARDIILRHRSPETPVGIVRAAMRENEDVAVTTLEKMLEHEIDMQTIVLVGNSRTFTRNGQMITPRGYERKKQYYAET